MALIFGFLSACCVGSLIEYAAHRALHGCLRDTSIGIQHNLHHIDYLYVPKSFWSNFRDYWMLGMLLCAMGFLYGEAFGIGWFSGAWFWVSLVAACHTLYHKCPPNFHTKHHEGNPFIFLGVTSPIWDYILGTYKDSSPKA